MSSRGLAAIIVLAVSFAVRATANNETAQSVTCTAVHDGVKHTAQVTCHFSSDVSSLVPVSLSVDFYPQGQSNTSVSVAECIWEADSDGCQMEKGRFSLSRSPSAGLGDMVLEIDNVTADDAGRYVCQQMSEKRPRIPSWPCALSVEDDPHTARPTDPGHEVATVTSDDHSTKGVSDSSGTTDGTDTGEAGIDVTTLLPAILVPVALVIAGVVACLLWRKRRQTRYGLKKEKTDEEEALSNTPKPYSDDSNATEVSEKEALNSTEIPEKEAPNSTEIPETADTTEISEKAAPDATEIPEPQEDVKDTSDGEPLVVNTDKGGFEPELETKPV